MLLLVNKFIQPHTKRFYLGVTQGRLGIDQWDHLYCLPAASNCFQSYNTWMQCTMGAVIFEVIITLGGDTRY